MYNDLQPGTGNDTWHSIFKQLDAAGLTSKVYYGLPTPLSIYWLEQFPGDRQSDATTDSQFYDDLAAGNLPVFSMVRPDYNYYSEEPPEDIEEGGGFWDHVAPPVKTQEGYGPRTPVVIVSRYARHGVFSQQTTNVSILPVTVTLIPPAGVSAPAGFPSAVTMTGGKATFTTTFTTPGYYRIEASGPNGSLGWTTVDVGVTPNTLP
ncbi:MAG TPA: alkaline phosphatase family protein [Solirubrobacteraceae bacterium]|jgi:hypothetical protein|nr:alkaline phosphatase family protein [Solirubrobacteraceae bacterium]